MKKLITWCLLLALILAFLCPLTVFAAEKPLWEEWGAESLEEFLE